MPKTAMDVVHKRRYSRGQKPGLTSTRVLYGPKPDQHEESNWISPTRIPTPQEKKKMLTLAIIAGVIKSMDNHTYRFDRVNRITQKNRAPAYKDIWTRRVASAYNRDATNRARIPP